MCVCYKYGFNAGRGFDWLPRFGIFSRSAVDPTCLLMTTVSGSPVAQLRGLHRFPRPFRVESRYIVQFHCDLPFSGNPEVSVNLVRKKLGKTSKVRERSGNLCCREF